MIAPIPDDVVSRVRELAELADVAEALGLFVVQKGAAHWTSLREEKEPSTVLNSRGRAGKKHATWKDFGTKEGGDAFALVSAYLGCSFPEAVRFVAQTVGVTIEGARPENMPKPPPVKVVEPIALDAQVAAISAFLDAVRAVVPDAVERGAEHLVGRGVREDVASSSCLVVPASAWIAIGKRAAVSHDPAMLIRAGLMRDDGPRGLRPVWWEDRALYLARSRDGESVVYLTGRALRSDSKGPKYSALGGPSASPYRLPFNLPDLAEAGRTGGRLLIVEGPVDAFAARSLGLLAISVGGRPDAKGADDKQSGTVRMLSGLRNALRQCREVLVSPDTDETREKRNTGSRAAVGCADWLIEQNIAAGVLKLPELGVSEKDLAAEAERRAAVESAQIPADDGRVVIVATAREVVALRETAEAIIIDGKARWDWRGLRGRVVAIVDDVAATVRSSIMAAGPGPVFAMRGPRTLTPDGLFEALSCGVPVKSEGAE